MNSLLSLMHNTAGKINRIKVRAKELKTELENKHPEFMKERLLNNPQLDGSFFLKDIERMVEELQKVLDAYYLQNKQ